MRFSFHFHVFPIPFIFMQMSKKIFLIHLLLKVLDNRSVYGAIQTNILTTHRKNCVFLVLLIVFLILFLFLFDSVVLKGKENSPPPIKQTPHKSHVLYTIPWLNRLIEDFFDKTKEKRFFISFYCVFCKPISTESYK